MRRRSDGSTTGCAACVYPGVGDRVLEDDGLFVTVTVSSLCDDVRNDPGEECDFGAANGTPETCCDAFCRFSPSTVVCRPSAGECDAAEMCQPNGYPANSVQPAGTACGDDGDLCSADVCDANGACVHPLLDGTVCGADNLCVCDHDGLFCTGRAQCPRGGGQCRALPTPCQEDDVCDEERNICTSAFGTPTPTATPSATVGSVTPATPTATISGAPTPTATISGAPTPTATVTAAPCTGDCDGNRLVVVNEPDTHTRGGGEINDGLAAHLRVCGDAPRAARPPAAATANRCWPAPLARPPRSRRHRYC